ncbi:hypothetical protein FRC02_011373 [Tulasnella sp. 418]|nr:hypothetical protein FRC02_011373 [Tulasnella sp. 418]
MAMQSRYLISPDTHSDVYAELFDSHKAVSSSSFATPSPSYRTVHSRKRIIAKRQTSPVSLSQENALFTPDVARWQSSLSTHSRSSSHSPDSNVGHNTNSNDSLILPTYTHRYGAVSSKRRANESTVIGLSHSRAHHELPKHAPKHSHLSHSSSVLAPLSSMPFKDHLKRQGIHLFKPNLYLPATFPGSSSVSLVTFPRDANGENQQEAIASGKASTASSSSNKTAEQQGRYPSRARASAAASKSTPTSEGETEPSTQAPPVSTVVSTAPKSRGKAKAKQVKRPQPRTSTPMTQPDEDSITMPPPTTLPAKRKRVRVHIEAEDDDAMSVTGSELAMDEGAGDPVASGRTPVPRAAKKRKVAASVNMPPPPDPPTNKGNKEASADAMVVDEPAPVIMTRTRSGRRGGARSGSPANTSKGKDDGAIKTPENDLEDKIPSGNARSTRSRTSATHQVQSNDTSNAASPSDESAGARQSPIPPKASQAKSGASKSPTASPTNTTTTSPIATTGHSYGTRRAAASQSMSRQSSGVSASGTATPSVPITRTASSATRASPPQLSFAPMDDTLADDHSHAEALLKAKMPRVQRLSDAPSVAVA